VNRFGATKVEGKFLDYPSGCYLYFIEHLHLCFPKAVPKTYTYLHIFNLFVDYLPRYLPTYLPRYLHIRIYTLILVFLLAKTFKLKLPIISVIFDLGRTFSFVITFICLIYDVK